MALQLKSECEKCHGALLANGMAMICSYECTFCEKCQRDEKCLPQLRRRISGPAPAEVNDRNTQ
jgi:hypothetical protein